MFSVPAGARCGGVQAQEGRNRTEGMVGPKGKRDAAFQEFVNGLASSFDLNRVAPSGVLDRNLKVYVWPNAEDLADK